MSNSIDQKIKKLYVVRSKRDAELQDLFADILQCKNSQSRRMNLEHLLSKYYEIYNNNKIKCGLDCVC